MSKLSFIIQVSGSPFGDSTGDLGYHGPHTHMRTEGRWPLEVGLNLARHGHKVTIASFNWGDSHAYKVPENITLREDFHGEYDVSIDAGWDTNQWTLQRAVAVKAKLYAHVWGGDPRGARLEEYATPRGIKNQFIATISRAEYKGLNAFPFGIYMPYPAIEKIRPIGNFSSRNMLFSNRGAWNLPYSERSEKILSLMESIQDSYHFIVLFFGDIKKRAAQLGRHNIGPRFESLKDKEFHDHEKGFLHNEFVEMESRCKILLSNGMPSTHPQNLEALCNGCIPLLWDINEHHFKEILPDGNYANVNEVMGYVGTNNIKELVSDETRYQEYYKALAHSAKDHEWDESYNILMNQISDRMTKL